MNRHAGRFTPLQAGLIGLVVILLAVFLAFSKDVPFTKPFEVDAVFQNVPPIQKGTAVRIAGVDVGKVSGVSSAGDGAHAVKVSIKLEKEALPLHEDATLKVRPRIFFEGNLFIDVRPGTPGADEVDSGHTFPMSQTAGEALNDSLADSAEALRGAAVFNQATLGSELHDLSKLLAGQQKITAALASREAQLKDLITNFNVTMGALASESDNLRETVRLLPRVLEAADPALDNLNAAFPPTRAWALEMVPGVRETPATIDAAFPWIRQTRALLTPAELQGLVADLSPAVGDFATFTGGQLELLPVLDDFNRCQYEVVLPTGEQTIEDGQLSTGLQSYKEFWQMMVGLTGESQNFDGNGNYVRFQAGGGGNTVATGPVGRGGPLHANATAPPLGTRPARTPKAPYRPNFECHRNPPADLNSAEIGGGP